MAKVISQETFDDVVKENVVEFAMTPDEAKEETIKQFEAQGINLANIIKDLTISEETGLPILTESINQLKSFISGEKELSHDALLQHIKIITNECNKSIPHRVLAGKVGAVPVILSIIEKEIELEDLNLELLRLLVGAANAVVNKQPDVFDAESLAIILRLLDTQHDKELIIYTLRWVAKACLMHEINRQNMMSSDILNHLKPFIQKDDPDIVKEVSAVFRHLILDDDIRVEFGKAHEHARSIAVETLADITKLLPKFAENESLSCDLILTIASLTVRNEFCVVVEDAGGLDFILDSMKKHPDSVKLAREAFKLLRALAGNDTVKLHIIERGAAPIIEDQLSRHRQNETLAKAALVCISTLTLRSKENSAALYETGIAETIVETMKTHTGSKSVQRNGAWAIRNMVSRSRNQCESFITCGAEDVLNDAIKNHPSVLQDIKAALRDLGCKVDLKEEWTGNAAIKIAR